CRSRPMRKHGAAVCSAFHFAKELSMTSLRRRMIEDLQIRNLSVQTRGTYVLQVSLFALPFNKSPEGDSRPSGLFDQRKKVGDRLHSPCHLGLSASSIRSPSKRTGPPAYTTRKQNLAKMVLSVSLEATDRRSSGLSTQ